MFYFLGYFQQIENELSNLKEKCAKNASRFVSDNFSQNTLKTRLAQLVAEVEKSPRYKSNLNKDAQKW